MKSKDIYSDLHKKTFFKGVASLGNMPVGSLGQKEG